MGWFVRIDQAAADEVAGRYSAAGAGAAAEVVRHFAQNNLARAGRVNTGALYRSIQSRQSGPFQWTVGSPLYYARFQEEGVRGPVLPRRAKVLRFKPKGSAVFIFRPRTRGFPGVFYLRDAYRSLRAEDFVP